MNFKLNSSGFSAIELMVAMAIIGILAAIAIPQYAAYKNRAKDSAVRSDLKNAMLAEEAYYASRFVYTANVDELTGFHSTANVDLKIKVVSDQKFVLTASHRECHEGTGIQTVNNEDTIITGVACQ